MIILSKQEFNERQTFLESLIKTHNGRVIPANNGGIPAVGFIFKDDIVEDCFWADYRNAAVKTNLS